MDNRLLFHIVCLVVFDLGLSMMNFALNKSANQSTTLYYNNFAWTADKAVDGNNNGSEPELSRTCSATIQTSSVAIHSWEVDIGVQIIVKNVNVYGRNDKAWNQLYGVKLYLGNKPGPWNYSKEFTSDPLSDVPNVTYVFKPDSVIARYISLMRSNIILTICEVTVQGDCIQGTYGTGCNETCGNCYNGNSSCSLVDGRCINGCEAGWRGAICKLNCMTGNYGFNCNETCGYCLNIESNCSKINGHCSAGCQSGWKGETCKSECKAGMYGLNCNETCGFCLNGNTSCSKMTGQCSGGCQSGWKGETCKLECYPGRYGLNCSETCGFCLNGNNSCSKMTGLCRSGCQAGWKGETCKLVCNPGTYGLNCSETCGFCLNGNTSCSQMTGHCSGGCQAGWKGETCKLGALGTDSSVVHNSNVGVIVGSVLAAVVVCIIVMVVIIVIVKKRRKGDNNETRTEMLTRDSHYVNLAFDNLAAESKAKYETTFPAMEEASIHKGTTNDNTKSFVTENRNKADNDYEKLRDGTGTPESAYSTINPNLIVDHKKVSMENNRKYVETLESIEGTLKGVEEEICSLLMKKEKLLSRELERARANKVADKKDENDSTLSDKDKDYTADDYAQTLRSLEGELRILEEKRKCILERKTILLRQEQAKKDGTKM